MKKTLSFLVNDRIVETQAWQGAPLLDFIRRELGLTGTKEGCREGDCGACAVLIGRRFERNAPVEYRAAAACLLAVGELEGTHLLTIEGLRNGSPGGLTPVMRALLEENGSQCGFCTPGFVIGLTAYLLEGPPLEPARAMAAIEGNLCRCTGYGAILRAAGRLSREFAGLPAGQPERFRALAQAGVVPAGLVEFAASAPPVPSIHLDMFAPNLNIGGGTDYYVQHPEADPEPVPGFALLDRDPELHHLVRRDGCIEIGAACTVREFFASTLVRTIAPGIENFEAEVASQLIRNRATLGGNIANASPVADMTAILIALGARLDLGGSTGNRSLDLERFYLGYKKLDLGPGELIRSVSLTGAPGAATERRFNFEKVSKRRRLDIAAVNTAALFELKEGRILRARLSAGGVAPVPLLLEKTSAALAGRSPDASTAMEAAGLAAGEISPISDARGSADYRRRLLERLVLAHFLRAFPERGFEREFLP